MTTPCPLRAHSPRLASGRWSCPECADGATQPAHVAAISAAMEAGRRGMAAAVAASPDDASRVRAAILRLAATGQPFSANDARALHGVRGGVVGATFNSLRAEGLIEPVGEETSTDRGTHGKRVALWVGAKAGQVAA